MLICLGEGSQEWIVTRYDEGGKDSKHDQKCVHVCVCVFQCSCLHHMHAYIEARVQLLDIPFSYVSYGIGARAFTC